MVWVFLQSFRCIDSFGLSFAKFGGVLLFSFVQLLSGSVGIDLWNAVKLFIQHRQGDRFLLYEEVFDELLVLSAFPIH